MHIRESRPTLALPLAGLLTTVFATTSSVAKDEPVPLADVPRAVLNAALRAVPGLVVHEVERESGKQGTWHYELEGLAGGVQVEVEVTPGGEVVDIEREDGRGAKARESSRTSVRATEFRALSRRMRPLAWDSSISMADAGVVELATEEAEIVAIATPGDGLLAWIVSPAPSCEGRGESSELALLRWPSKQAPAAQSVLDLGPGEATSVAALPDGRAAVVVSKDPLRPNLAPGRALLVADGKIVRSSLVGPGPDSVAVTPDGRFAIVACEASEPDDDDCPAESPGDDLPGSVHVLELDRSARWMRTVAVVEGERIFASWPDNAPRRAEDAREIEPEFVAVSPDSSLALVTLQEQSAVVVVDLRAIAGDAAERFDPPVAGARALAGIVHLPHGVQPDGIAVSPDGSFALTANEAGPRAPNLQGASVLDLRGGPDRARHVATRSIFELDSTLRRGERNGPETAGPGTPPRLDPEGVAMFQRGRRTLAALAIERSAPDEWSGSVLFLDVTGAADGRPPARVARLAVGATSSARPEGIVASADGSMVFVACERDGGTLSRISIREPAAATGGR